MCLHALLGFLSKRLRGMSVDVSLLLPPWKPASSFTFSLLRFYIFPTLSMYLLVFFFLKLISGS